MRTPARLLAGGLLTFVLLTASRMPAAAGGGQVPAARNSPSQGGALQNGAAQSGAAAKAVRFLAVEVPRWRREHPCYSCHNNGDGTRALAAAAARGLIDLGPFEEELRWLRTPERWALNSTEGGVKDLPLARIQFAAALAQLVSARGADDAALARAAELLVADQRPDGSWATAAAAIGSPAGYGTALATAAARRVLLRDPSPAARGAVARADAWFRTAEAPSVIESAAVLLGLGTASDAGAVARRTAALEVIAKGEARDGGWGPYVTSQPEPFDTAVVVLALDGLALDGPVQTPALASADVQARIARGRTFLVSRQEDDGSWVETTRPAGQESYAQRISTSGWALLALLGER